MATPAALSSRLLRFLSPSQLPSKLLYRRRLSSGADYHGTRRVNIWEDPLSPSKWKEEHLVLSSLSGWGLAIYGGYKLFSGDKKEEAGEVEMAKKVSQLEKELEDTRQTLEAAQVRIAELETRPAEQQPSSAGPSRVGKQIRILGDDMAYIRREIARATGKVVLSRLKVDDLLKPEAMDLTVMDIIPALLAEESNSPMRDLPSSSADSEDDDSEDEGDDGEDVNADGEDGGDDDE